MFSPCQTLILCHFFFPIPTLSMLIWGMAAWRHPHPAIHTLSLPDQPTGKFRLIGLYPPPRVGAHSAFIFVKFTLSRSQLLCVEQCIPNLRHEPHIRGVWGLVHQWPLCKVKRLETLIFWFDEASDLHMYFVYAVLCISVVCVCVRTHTHARMCACIIFQERHDPNLSRNFPLNYNDMYIWRLGIWLAVR